MKADQILDWIIAIVVLVFILAPLISSIFMKKKVVRKESTDFFNKHPQKQLKPVFKDVSKEEISEVNLDLKKTDKKSSKKKLLDRNNLKKAIVLTEILKRPYIDDN